MTETSPPGRISELITAAAEQLKARSENPHFEAEVLLSEVLGRNRSYFRAYGDQILSESQNNAFLDLVQRRQSGQPIAYLLGYREFWRHRFKVSPEVLIPRHETETLVEAALEEIRDQTKPSVLDLGTGSGIIAISIGLERRDARVIATDKSPAALKIAKANACHLGCGETIRFFEGDWLSAIPKHKRFDLIVSNPPYIAEDDPHLESGDLQFEPRQALSSGPDGLNDIRKIAQGARHYLKPQGILMIEHGFNQAKPVKCLLETLGFSAIQSVQDLAGHQRITRASYGTPQASCTK